MLAGEQAALSASMARVAGPGSRDTTPANGGGRRGIGGLDSDRERDGLSARRLMPSSRRRSARRLLAAGDAERERIEQDLHDGVQQHLTGVRIRLSLAADKFAERGETEASAVLQGFSDDVDDVIDELRDLAHGIYPALLTSDGLGAALVCAGLHAPRPVSVHASGVRRCRPGVEIAVYFSRFAALDIGASTRSPRASSTRSRPS
jgi:signal transduction histidine kinase